MAQHRHKRETNARLPKAVQVAGSIAVMATLSAVSLGVLTASPESHALLASSAGTGTSTGTLALPFGASTTALREDIVSRSESRLRTAKLKSREARDQTQQDTKKAAQHEARQGAKHSKQAAQVQQTATLRAVSGADTTMWTTTELNLWAGPDADAAKLGVIDGSKKVLVTGRAANGRVELVVNDRSRWVTAGYLSDSKPVVAAAQSTDLVSSGPCANGSVVDGGANVLKVHAAVCAAFPEITSYGTYRGGGGDHPLGLAIDIMVSGSRGFEVADFVRANYAALGVSYIIYSQHIWSVERAGEGWRAMPDRGSVTANHYDHVHVSTY